MADSNATETAAVMIDGDRNGKWLTATAMGSSDGNGNRVGDGDGDGDGNHNGDSHARATMTKGGLPLHVPELCSAVAGATPCLHPMDTKESAFTSAASWW